MDRGVDEDGVIVRDRINDALRKLARQHFHLGLDRAFDFERVRPGKLKDADAGCGLIVDREHLAVGFSTELDPTDVAQPRNLPGIAGFHDNVFEFPDVR
jgi:hypothetical protein